MKKFKQILAFGDSTLTGVGFDPANIQRWDDITKLSSFPNQLAKMLGIPCINTSISGGSNDRSLRLLPETLLSYPDSLVLFCYTFNERTEIFNHNLINDYAKLGYEPIIPSNSRPNHISDAYYKYIYDNTVNQHNRYKIYNMLLTVQTLCEKYAADYLQIFLMNSIFLDPVFQQSVYDALDKTHIHKFNVIPSVPGDGRMYKNTNESNQGFGDFYRWELFNGFRKAHDGKHAGEYTHAKFAEELYIKYNN